MPQTSSPHPTTVFIDHIVTSSETEPRSIAGLPSGHVRAWYSRKRNSWGERGYSLNRRPSIVKHNRVKRKSRKQIFPRKKSQFVLCLLRNRFKQGETHTQDWLFPIFSTEWPSLISFVSSSEPRRITSTDRIVWVRRFIPFYWNLSISLETGFLPQTNEIPQTNPIFISVIVICLSAIRWWL